MTTTTILLWKRLLLLNSTTISVLPLLRIPLLLILWGDGRNSVYSTPIISSLMMSYFISGLLMILFVFEGSENALFQFRDYINNTDPSLKFTIEHNTEKIHFLDLLISVNEKRTLDMSIYHKETDRNTILYFLRVTILNLLKRTSPMVSFSDWREYVTRKTSLTLKLRIWERGLSKEAIRGRLWIKLTTERKKRTERAY